MPGLLDMYDPSGKAQQLGFFDTIGQNRNSLIGLGLGLAGSSRPGFGDALQGFQRGASQDAQQAARQQQQQMERARLKLAQQQANKEPEEIRRLRAAGVPQEKWADYLYPKQDEWKEGKVTYREQEYPYRANLRSGQYEWGPLGAPPGIGGAARPAAPPVTPQTIGGIAGAGAQEQEPPKPAGYESWLPSVQKEYDKTRVQQQAKQAAAEPEQKAQILESGTVALREIDAALKQSEAYPNMVAGPFGNMMKGVPGSQATDVAKRLDVVKATIAFDRLQAMRRSSPTGGALGNVSDKDMALLQSSLASLDQAQSASQFTEGLRNVQTHYRNVLAKIQGSSSGAATSVQPSGQSSSGVRKYNPTTGKIE